MNKFFDFIDRHKFGVIGAFMVYIGIFMYLQLKSVPDYFEIKAFNQGARIEQEQEVEITPDNIEVPSDFQSSDVTNTARDMNDTRKRSEEDWSAVKSEADYDKMVKEQEKQMFSETGGDTKRQAMLREMEEQKKQPQKENNPTKSSSSSKGSDNAAGGNVMVEWSLKNRKPHNNDEWHVRNPGYTCGKGANGRVAITIKVGRDGRVKTAEVDYAGTQNANDCMIRQAKRYAEMSRFNVSGGDDNQVGKIYYTFVSQ